MTINDFWYATEEEFHAYVTAYNNRINKIAWLNGMYTSNALNVSLGNMFSSKGGSPLKYPEEPYGANESKIISSNVNKEQQAQDILCECY